MNREVPYWNPYLETLTRDSLERLQLKKFKRILTWAYDNSRFHRKLYQDAGVHPDDINSLDRRAQGAESRKVDDAADSAKGSLSVR